MTSRKIFWLGVALVVIAGLALATAGCGTTETGGASASPGGAAGGPKQGGTLTVGYQGEPTGLDPAIAYENEAWTIENMLYNGLIKYVGKSGEAGTEIVPDLAEAMPTISADSKTYTFKLRQGVKFAAPVSREVTADDFKWSFERMMKLPKAPATSLYETIVGATAYLSGKATGVSGFKALDKYTIEIQLTQPDATIMNKLAMPFTWVLPKEWVAKWGTHFNRHPLGTGQYIMKSWTTSKMVLDRNPDFFEPSKVYADQWVFDFTPTPSRQVLMIQKGDIDIMGNDVPPADLVRLQNDPKWKDYILSYPQIANAWTFYNIKYKPFDNKLVRQAINYAINRDKLVKLQSGAAMPNNQVYPDGLPGYEPNADYYPYDPAKAKELLAQAGFPNGFKTTYWCLNTDPFPKVAQSVIYDLNAVGIKTDLKLMEESAYWTANAAPAKGISIGFNDWYMDFPDPSDWIGLLYTKASTAPGGMNSGNWWDPRVEALYKQAEAMPPGSDRIALYTQMQQIIMEEAVVDPMFQFVGNPMYGPNLGGFYAHPVWLNNYIDYWRK
jgi:peptide/nickel transport system substrate-binding protein